MADLMGNIEFLSFVLDAILLVLVALMSRENVPRVRKILNILRDGVCKDCPYNPAKRG